MVKENTRVRSRIPELFAPLMVLHLERVDEVISPGLTALRWTSLGLEAYLRSVHAALQHLELLIDRAVGLHEDRIKVVLGKMLTVPLCEMPVDSTVHVEDFVASTAEYCRRAGLRLDNQSLVVERAVEELLALMVGQSEEEEEAKESADLDAPGAMAAKRRIEKRTKVQQEADALMQFYEQKTTDTLTQLTRNTLDGLRRRLAISGLVYGDYEATMHKNDHPLFKAEIVLSIPSLAMQPSLDNIQQALNKAVGMITAVGARVHCWGQKRLPAPPSEEKPLVSRSDSRLRGRGACQPSTNTTSLRSYHNLVSEHKEVAKLVSALSTSINSTKTLVAQAMDLFSHYRELWVADREEHMKNHVETEPTVNDYRTDMQVYAEKEAEIMAEPAELPAGAILLSCERLKVSLCAEAKSWKVCFGRAMSRQYQAVMEDVFSSIDDWTKQLARPLNDLDDIRGVMATMKDIRENEIRVDMSLEPIEVS